MFAKITTTVLSVMLIATGSAVPAVPVQSDELKVAHIALESTRVTLSLEHPVSLQNAVRIKEVAGDAVVAYRFESEFMVGEFSPETGL